MLEELGLDSVGESFAAVFGGSCVLDAMEPFAACYGGHQFGNWAGQLGDGRAISLGEVVNDAGRRWELQLKGAGPTPYSRRGDGRAVLRSSIREFLCSEAMFHLGVPTTRALSLVLTGDQVPRDMFYDGNMKNEAGAVVCRAAPSFLRFGSYQIHSARKDRETLERLVRYTLKHHHPDLYESVSAGRLGLFEATQSFFDRVCRSTARMVADWMRVGFVHGVMNTDNMSILGLTIDYGPYGWVEDFDPGWTPNTTDASGRRYRFGAQAEVAAWNLGQLAFALSQVGPETQEDSARLTGFEGGMKSYWKAFDEHQRRSYAAKLGFAQLERAGGPEDPEGDLPLVNDLLSLLSQIETDMTIFFRRLADAHPGSSAAEALEGPLNAAFYDPAQLVGAAREAWVEWLERYQSRSVREAADPEKRRASMNAANPNFVLRNYLAQLAIDKAEAGDASMVLELLDTLRRPYDEQPGREAFADKRPEWARHRAGCSMLSCSS
jgi:uncharacterized protein YdiU (UPF0061 family)